jgi:hypothetical protein
MRRSSAPSFARATAALALAALHLGCIGARFYRPESVLARDGYDLAFIELDDQGELWSPQQVVRATDLVASAGAAGPGVIQLVFIHGWQHNAAPGDQNVAGLEGMLEQIVRVERLRSGAEARRVVGVYVGWRGKTSPFRLLRMLSFYSRFRAAKRVASTAATETFFRLLLAGRTNPANTTVVVGHSFGGLILESALAQAMIGALGAAVTSGTQQVDFPADLVLLLNPASQAIEAKQLVDIFERYHVKFYRDDDAGNTYEVPLVVSLTSSADVATRVLFPLGMRLRGVGNQFRPYGAESCARGRQAAYFRRTAGNQRALHSHLVSVERSPSGRPPGSPLREESEPPRLQHAYDPTTRLQTWSVEGVDLRYHIHQNPRSWNDTPYWIMEVPPAVFPDHSRIFGWETIEFAGALIAMSGALEGSDLRARLVRDDRVKPVLLAARSDGLVSFVDRSQRIFEIDPQSSEPGFVWCVPDALTNVAEVLAVAGDGDSAWVAGTLRGHGEHAGETRLGVVRLEQGQRGIESDSRSLPRDVTASAAAFDRDAGVLYVARRDTPTLDRVDLGRRTLDPETLLDLGAGGELQLLEYDAGGNRLFASDGRSTAVEIDLDESPPALRRIPGELALPAALAWDGERERLYVATAGDAAVWKIECAASCGAPERWASVPELRHPRSLAIDGSGRVWVGDLESRLIVGLSPAGEVLRRIERLPQEF